MQILIIGGAGYIGSHMVQLARRAGFAVVVLDDLSSGHADALHNVELVVGSLADRALLDDLFTRYRFAAVMHFASFIQVGESVKEPSKYYANNLSATLNLLDAMRKADVASLIFSSTAAVYGNPDYHPIDEAHPKQPINPYGRSKWMVEQILEDYDRAYGLKSICLRYFNAAGADPTGSLGERHLPETHLIPLVLQAAAGRSSHIAVFGTDFDTPDGTCIRDYIHVVDLCDAHLLALQHLLATRQSARYNLGNGEGYSVQQVIDTARQVTGREIRVRNEARRAGDPARLVANAHRVRHELGWKPCRAALATIIADAWQWERKYPWIVAPA
ncbi:MAG: UDP-glucose 4-epimerase GalE [Rhodocyclaceae bacterium]|nr:UDP-glucose 4-epimerase GalE [Rhodocyclaceae bacterium]MDZ4213928.1 UDP-glucose 4-epimerase GalE [Rhodocyclaceae bacterium]